MEIAFRVTPSSMTQGFLGVRNFPGLLVDEPLGVFVTLLPSQYRLASAFVNFWATLTRATFLDVLPAAGCRPEQQSLPIHWRSQPFPESPNEADDS